MQLVKTATKNILSKLAFKNFIFFYGHFFPSVFEDFDFMS